jgi:hypothetical protein
MQTIHHQRSRSYIPARENGQVNTFDAAKDFREKPFDFVSQIDNAGIGFHSSYMSGISSILKSDSKFAMDNLQPGVLQGTISTPVQFLQEWLPGFVHILTSKRQIDVLVGLSILGAWHDEQVVQSAIELLGNAVPYGDLSNVNLSDWNPSYNFRTIVRFEEGLMVGRIEEARAAEVRINSGAEKRNSVALSLEISRNQIGFFGFNAGANQTYGLLNDPSLPSYNSVVPGASLSTLWVTKTFLEITADIRQMTSGIRSQSQEQIDPSTAKMTLALPTNIREQLTVTTTLGGYSVENWLKDNYPNIRVVSCPEFYQVNGGQSVGYLYAENVDDTSTDDGAIFLQAVPTKFMFLGVEQKAKGYVEAYSNATSGIMCKRPFGVYRVTGI